MNNQINNPQHRSELALIQTAKESINELIEQITKADYKDRNGNRVIDDPAAVQLVETLSYLNYYDQYVAQTLQ